MKKTIKLSLLVGTGIVGALLLLLKLFQPITKFHLILISYSVIIGSVITGILVHLNNRKNAIKKDFYYFKYTVRITKKNGEILKGILSDISHLALFIENAISSESSKVKEKVLVPLSEIKTLEIE